MNLEHRVMTESVQTAWEKMMGVYHEDLAASLKRGPKGQIWDDVSIKLTKYSNESMSLCQRQTAKLNSHVERRKESWLLWNTECWHCTTNRHHRPGKDPISKHQQ